MHEVLIYPAIFLALCGPSALAVAWLCRRAHRAGFAAGYQWGRAGFPVHELPVEFRAEIEETNGDAADHCQSPKGRYYYSPADRARWRAQASEELDL